VIKQKSASTASSTTFGQQSIYDTFEVLGVEVTADRKSLDPLLYLEEVLQQCRGRPVVRTDSGLWYDWRLE